MPMTRTDDYATSNDAAFSLRHKLNDMRVAVHDVLSKFPEGLTDEELTAEMHKSGHPFRAESTYRKRRTELMQDGWVMDSGQTRKNSNGCQMVVWVTARKLPDRT